MRRLALLLLAVLALGLAACGDDEQNARDETVPQASTAATQATTTGCRPAEEPEAREVEDRKAPSFRPEDGTTYTAVLQTSCGTVEIELATEQAPKTTGSFISLVRDGFYDGLAFHRIIQGFVVQGGDPLGDGTGGPGYEVVEAPPEDLTYTQGVVAMAKGPMDEPGASGSQFFIVSGEDAGLPPDYALVGRVTEGMDVVERLSAVPTDPTDDRPVDPVVIERATIETA